MGVVDPAAHPAADDLLQPMDLDAARGSALPFHRKVPQWRAVAIREPAEQALVVEHGTVVDLWSGRIQVVGRIGCSYSFVDHLALSGLKL